MSQGWRTRIPGKSRLLESASSTAKTWRARFGIDSDIHAAFGRRRFGTRATNGTATDRQPLPMRPNAPKNSNGHGDNPGRDSLDAIVLRGSQPELPVTCRPHALSNPAKSASRPTILEGVPP